MQKITNALKATLPTLTAVASWESQPKKILVLRPR
jgi:hypothetical protein